MARKNDYPGMTRFQRENGGQPVTGFSGIVPFVRNRNGVITAPVGPTKTNFRK